MNILQMRYFVAVADNLSFTIASKKLYVSQPSISKQVAALEDEIGMKLFDRTGKKLLLTNSGELLYHDFKILLQNIDELIQKAHDISDSVVGRLRIGMMEDMNIPQVTRGKLLKFTKDYPLIKTEFISGTGDLLSSMCNDGKLDCIIALDYVIEGFNSYTPINALPIYHAPSRIVYRKDYFNVSVPTHQHLNNTPYIIISGKDQTAIMQRTALLQLTDSGITPSDIIWVDSLDSLLLNVYIGLGVGIVGPTVRLPNDHDLQYMPLPGVNKDVVIKLCWKSESNSPILDLFIGYFK